MKRPDSFRIQESGCLVFYYFTVYLTGCGLKSLASQSVDKVFFQLKIMIYITGIASEASTFLTFPLW